MHKTNLTVSFPSHLSAQQMMLHVFHMSHVHDIICGFIWCLDFVFVGSASFHLPQLCAKVFLQARHHSKVEICRDSSQDSQVWYKRDVIPSEPPQKFRSDTHLSTILQPLQPQNASLQMKTAYLGPGKQWKPMQKRFVSAQPRYRHGFMVRSAAFHLPKLNTQIFLRAKLKIALTHALRSSSDSGNLNLSLCRCHGIHIGGWLMMAPFLCHV